MEWKGEPTTQSPKRRFARLFWVFLASFIWMEALTLFSGMMGNSMLKIQRPLTSSFMASYQIRHFSLAKQSWVDLDQISPHLKRALLVSEDDAFFEHNGIDLDELKNSLMINFKKKKIVRGASTLTMQLIKNLYFYPSKSPLRKMNEILLALDLETKVSKKRIFEAYLNIVEWGPGIYGAEEASQYYFNTRAKFLNQDQAAYLAAILPNPNYFTHRGKRRGAYRKNKILHLMSGRSLPNGI